MQPTAVRILAEETASA